MKRSIGHIQHHVPLGFSFFLLGESGRPRVQLSPLFYPDPLPTLVVASKFYEKDEG